MMESSSRHYVYSRKQKSIGLLCSNFLSMYNMDAIEFIGLDEAAAKLGVERGRIYDIVNVWKVLAVSKLNNNNQIASWDTRFETGTSTSLLQPFSPIVIAANENEWIRVWDYEEEGTPPQWL
ncbi:hypothetical protein V6N13_140058 [Hibiscus sabdariffa]